MPYHLATPHQGLAPTHKVYSRELNRSTKATTASKPTRISARVPTTSTRIGTSATSACETAAIHPACRSVSEPSPRERAATPPRLPRLAGAEPVAEAEPADHDERCDEDRSPPRDRVDDDQ